MELEVETTLDVGDAAMISPCHGSTPAAATGGLTIGNGLQHESLRLSEIESAHLCPSARVKMEELFKQWLNVDGTKDMIHAIVDDIRSGKDMDAIVAQYASNQSSAASGGLQHSGSSNHSTPNGDLHSPSRSPKRPPNYHHFGGSSATSSGVHHSPNSTNSRKKHLAVSLFGDELHEAEKREQADVAMKEDEAEVSAAQTPDADQAMDEDNTNSNAADEQTALKQLRKQIPKLYTPGEGRRGRLRGLSTDSMARKSVGGCP